MARSRYQIRPPQEVLDEINETEEEVTEPITDELDIKEEVVIHNETPTEEEVIEPVTNIDTDNLVITEPISIAEPITKSNKINIFIEFPKPAYQVECVLSTGYKDKVVAASNSLRLLQNRLYFIPVNDKTVNSDEYTIKVMSDVSSDIDVRYIKDGLACIMSLKHNVKISQGDRIAVLIS
jgi:hypothetical protein